MAVFIALAVFIAISALIGWMVVETVVTARMDVQADAAQSLRKTE